MRADLQRCVVRRDQSQKRAAPQTSPLAKPRRMRNPHRIATVEERRFSAASSTLFERGFSPRALTQFPPQLHSPLHHQTTSRLNPYSAPVISTMRTLEEKTMAYELPPLPYDYAALEPVIDKQTMTIHHDLHHGAYVKNLNAAIEKHPELGKKTAEDLIRDLNALPEDIRGAVRNNAGGHVNHTMFWQIMKPKGGGDPNGPIADAINKTFGSFKDFQTKFNDAGVKQFGSGWVWLAGAKGDVHIMSTPNQDSPISVGHFPIFGNDVWEHAYYLKYNNRRPEYLSTWWNVINWDEVNQRYEAYKSGKAVEELALAR
jgi:superoxide dismutase, Fe-Mn family